MGLKISENALKVLERRYLKKDNEGRVIETPEEMFHRVAKTIADIDRQFGASDEAVAKLEKDFYEMMTHLEFMPNSPTLMNAGRPLGQLSACFVLPIEDSMESIFETLKITAIIHKSGGGTGFSFSKLREKNSIVQATGGIASGPVSFMKVFDGATQAVKQGGTRRGANMGILRVDHPDILEFITCKENDKEICNFNISVAITEGFWQALEKGEDYDLISPHTGKVAQRLNAAKVFDLIVKSAHRNGEPGLIFIDRMNQFNPTPQLGQYESTNPCGEQVLLPYESCNLGSINLLHMIKKVNGQYEVDWDKLKSTTRKAVHFLDSVIDANRHPVAEIEKRTKLTRKIGLGVMGWASVLARMGLPYKSDEALALAGGVMSTILSEARAKSCELAKTRGVFPAFSKSIFDSGGEDKTFLTAGDSFPPPQRRCNDRREEFSCKQAEKMRLRNATLTTIAPTGTISIIGGPCSSGIEPIFAICYYRNVMDNTKLVEVDPVFEAVARERGFYSQELMQKIAEAGSIQTIEGIPDDVKRVFVTAHEISPEWHMRMQAEFQKYTDNAVSKTINFPHSATEEDVRQAFVLAYQLGCKGVTIYRDGSRQEQVLNISKKKEQKENPAVHQQPAVASEELIRDKVLEAIKPEPGPHSHSIEPRPRPEVTHGTTSKVLTGCGNLYVVINTDEGAQPFEVFAQMGKAGGCAASQLEAIARLTSLALRSGVDGKAIVEQLRGIRCPAPSWYKGTKIFSCADAISQVLERRLNEKASGGNGKTPLPQPEQNPALRQMPLATPTEVGVVNKTANSRINMVGVCPDCGNPLHHEEGCLKCYGCGFTKC